LKNIVRTLFLCLIVISSCKKEDNKITNIWVRFDKNPIFRDTVLNVAYNYEVASDAHVFLDENSSLKMIYTGDVNEKVSIKLASGNSWSDWKKAKTLIHEPNSAGTDVFKETAFYRKSSTGKHQIFYIGYEKEETYESQIFLAEADSLNGEYYQYPQPVVQRGMIAGKNVYCITSPSIVEHEGELYMVFIGWNAKPNEVTEVWIIGAKSTDDGLNWHEFQLVDTRIGMEGQLTKISDGNFVAVRTSEYKDKEAIFYATASHPFGPWYETSEPILIQDATPYEKDEIIAAQITIDVISGKQYLYYTGADYQKGYWIMMATKE
jgi:hypothetical protein